MTPAEGELALVLHTHMPYVEGFGTWPFGEEWLWEAIATSYVPLLDVLERPGGDALTVSLTPVLADQLESAEAMARCVAFLREMRPETHRRDIDGATDEGVVRALQHSAAVYERAADRLEEIDLLQALASYASWTSSATHAVLPLLATDAGVRLQLRSGAASHRRRFDGWGGGLWLPECAYAPWLDRLLAEAGVRATCVELPGVDSGPLRTAAGTVLVPIDRAVIDLVWSEGGYPSHGPYRDYHNRTEHHHRARSIDGGVYEPERAAVAVREDAADFVRQVLDRCADGRLVVCALDTELLGHWWHEGPLWLAAVLDEARTQGLRIARLDDALTRHEATAAPDDLPVCTWGVGRDLRTWSAPAVADLADTQRRLELEVVARRSDDPGVARELLALQASDWAFVVTRELAEPYGRERVETHAERLRARIGGKGSTGEALRNLAPDVDTAALRDPG